MQNLSKIAAATAGLGTAAHLEPAGAVPYPAQCQFNHQQAMACTISSNPFTWKIDWANGVRESSVRHHTPSSSTLGDQLRGVWNRQSNGMGQQEVRTHANGNRITIIFREQTKPGSLKPKNETSLSKRRTGGHQRRLSSS